MQLSTEHSLIFRESATGGYDEIKGYYITWWPFCVQGVALANLIYSGIESPFGLLVYDEPPTISEVISELEWGSNSDIRKRGSGYQRN